MGFFDSLRRPREPVPTLEELARRAQEDPQGALEAANAKLSRVEARVGKEHPAYAAALFEHASLLLALGMTARAVEALRAASASRGSTHEDEKNRLTYLMSLGDVLGHAGQLEEGLAVHDRTLVERERFYGKQHPGYAYGLGSWADVAIALGRFADAVKAAQEALAIFDATGHARVANTWALIFLAAAGSGAQWKSLQIPPAMADAILREVSQRVLPVTAVVQLRAVEALERFAGDRQRILEAWVAVDARARRSNDNATRRAALARVRDLAGASGNARLALDAELGIALCHDKDGDEASATAGYERALAMARELRSPDALSKTARNAGLYFVRWNPDRGLSLLREAQAVEGAPLEDKARAGVALGIQLQHRELLADARPILARALTLLDPMHPDAICGRSHLQAIEEQQSCGCGDTRAEIHAQVERLVRKRLPDGLLDRLEFEPDNVNIHVTRPLSESETRLVADTVDLAMAELRRRIGDTYSG